MTVINPSKQHSELLLLPPSPPPRFPPHLLSPLLTPLLGRHPEVTLWDGFRQSQPYTRHARGVWKQTGAGTFALTYYKYSSRTWCSRHRRQGPPASVTTGLHCRLIGITQDTRVRSNPPHTSPRSRVTALWPAWSCADLPLHSKSIASNY